MYFVLLGRRQSQETEAADEHAFSQSSSARRRHGGRSVPQPARAEWNPWKTSLDDGVMPGQAEKGAFSKIGLADGSCHQLRNSQKATVSTRGPAHLDKSCTSPENAATTVGLDTEATCCTVLLAAPSNSKEQGGSATDNECLPPHVTDSLAERNRPMSRAMECRGRTTSSFVKFPAECSCIWAECKCVHSNNVESGTGKPRPSAEASNQVIRVYFWNRMT